MSGSGIEFGHAEGALKEIAERVIVAKEEFRKHAEVLDGQIKDIRLKWQGEGGNAFQILNEAWNEKHKVVTTALDKFHASLTETEKDNVAVDQQAGTGMNNLINKLGQL